MCTCTCIMLNGNKPTNKLLSHSFLFLPTSFPPPLSLSPYLPPSMFAVLPLNTENVASVFQIVPLISIGGMLWMPDKLHSQPLKAAGWYVDEGKRCSWRWIVFSLDHCNETNVSDYLLPYVESPAGVMSYIQWSCTCTCIYIYVYTCMYMYVHVYVLTIFILL